MGDWVGIGVRKLGLSAALAVVFGIRPGVAASAPVHLEWRAPPECPQSETVEEGVQRLIGHDRRGLDDGPRFSAVMQKLADGVWKLELSVTNSEGTRRRELSSDSCHELTEAGIAVIALALSETTTKPADTPPSAPAASHPAASSSHGVAAHPASASEDPRRDAGPQQTAASVDPHWGAHAAMVVDFMMLPSTAAGPALGADYTFGPWRLSARALYLPPQYASLAEQHGAEISLIAGNLGAQYWWIDAAFGLGPSLQVEAGTLPARGVSEEGMSGNGRWAAVIPGAAARWRLGDAWALFFGADLVIPVVRDEFMLGANQVYQVPAVGGRLVLGPEVRFP